MNCRCRSLTKSSRALLAGASLALSAAVFAQAARDNISIVGSSTVYPFATVVAEQFGRSTAFRTPTIESTGSGGGINIFCQGIGVQYPDITNSSRRIRPSELAACAGNGVSDVIEVKIGYDGIVLAHDRSSASLSLTRAEVFLALAKTVPDPTGSGNLVPNPYELWSEINPALPDVRIEVYGPPPTSGTRDAFLELVMEPGCEHFDVITALGDEARDMACLQMREDGRFIEAGENDNLIVQKLQANPDSVGIFGYSFLEQNGDVVSGAIIDGVEPEFDSIAEGRYPISRPLYFYVKAAHVDAIPGIREYLEEFVSEDAWGEFGYLADKGLIPLAEDERLQVAHAVRELQALTPADLAN